MRSNKIFWAVSCALACAGFSGGFLFSHEPVTTADRAVWKEVYSSPAEMLRRADLVVLARVAGTRPGRVVTSATGEDVLPFQIVDLRVVEGIKGAAAGARLSLERAGGTRPDGVPVFLSYDGGPFEKGATYLLFLQKQDGGPHYFQVNVQGRFLVAHGRLWAADPEDRVAVKLEAAPAGPTLDALRSLATRQRRRG
jgi:hypothetical protein